MADEPTIPTLEEAKARLRERVNGSRAEYVDARPDDLRTLLASHASLEERVGEAKRLAESALAMLRHTHDRLLSAYPEFDTLCISLNTEARALAAFVNEKET